MNEEQGRENRSELVEVLTSSNPGELAIVKSLLDGENIPYLAQGEEFSIIRGGGALPVRVLVPAMDAGRARELIKELIDNRTKE